MSSWIKAAVSRSSQRGQRNGRSVPLPTAPVRTAVQQLRPRRAEDEERHPACPVDEVIHEIEQAVVGPLQILEHEHGRTSLGERLEIPAPTGERILTVPSFLFTEPDQRQEVTLHPRCVTGVDDVSNGRDELFPHLSCGVGLENACLRLHHLAERPQAHAVPIGQRATLPPRDQLARRRRGDRLHQLVHETGLADAGYADERDELHGRLASSSCERFAQHGQLVIAPYERRASRLHDVDAEARSRLLRLPHRNCLGLALCLDRLAFGVVDHVSSGAIRRLADEYPVDERRRLQARRRVDDVPGRHRLSSLGTRTQSNQRFACVHRDPHLQLLLITNPVADRQRRAHCPLRIVLVRDRRAEQSHHRIADEFLDGAAVPLQLTTQPCVVRRKQRAHILGIHRLHARREADEIGEQDRDDLALLPGRRGLLERRAAAAAEAESLRILLTAFGAAHLAESVFGCREEVPPLVRQVVMDPYLLNQEVARFRRTEVLREGANERLARKLTIPEEEVPPNSPIRWARKRLGVLRPSFRPV